MVTRPRDLVAAVAGHPLFAGFGESVLSSIADEVEWFSLPGGWTLFHQGAQANAMYLLTSGCLAVFVRHDNGKERLVARIYAGETVGEMALISGEPRSATVVALRDSSVLRIASDTFDRLIYRHPEAMFHLTKLLVDRLMRTTRPAKPLTDAKTIALVPIHPEVPCSALSHGLSKCLTGFGKRVTVLDSGMVGRTAEWFHLIEQAHDVILYQAEPKASSWTRLCLRQADRVLLISGSPTPNVVDPPLEAILRTAPLRRCDLAILHEAHTQAALDAGSCFDSYPVGIRHHLRLESRNDLARLARFLTGRAVGIVLSSGGARGFAHLGVIRALRRYGVPLDLLGGTSMGAIIAVGAALEWDDNELAARLHQAFVATNPLNDYTLPMIALARGRKVTNLLRHYFGDLRFEQLWRPCFCVSSNLTSAQAMVHRSGPLWRALRASVAIPGLLPPIVENGEVLVDGGVIDGFPIGTMRALHSGPLIGVNVSTNRALSAVSQCLEDGSPWWFLRHHARGAPGIVSLLMRAGTVSSDAQTRVYREQVDLLVEPPIESVDLLDWGAFNRAVELGYEYTMKRLEKLEGSLFQGQIE